ncbi:hypothetical protein BGZ65_000870, partial [Modicella reniformis]
MSRQEGILEEVVETKRPSLLPTRSSSPKSVNETPGDEANQPYTACRFFESSPSEPRKVTFEGINCPPWMLSYNVRGSREKRSSENAATIPVGTPTFKFIAEFKRPKVGHYVVSWRVKLFEGFHIPNGLRFSVAVEYDPTNISGSFDVTLSPEELEELGTGLPNKHIVKRAAKSQFESETTEAPRFWTVEPSGTRPDELITRLAWSKDSSFLAALSVRESSAHITVWDMGSIEDLPEQMRDTSFLRPSSATADVIQKIPKPCDFSNLSIGLAISPKGDQVAIYQEPNIGQWRDGSRLFECSFPIRLFNNPLVPNQDDIAAKVEENVPDQDSTSVEVEEITPPQLVEQEIIPHRIFDSFIGYGAFLTEKKNIGSDRNSVIYDNPCANASDEKISSSETKTTSSSTTDNTLFVACNGMYIDVFEVIPEKPWTHIRTIQLTDLVPTLSRRIMCKTMMETISSNTFMWLEDNGLCCTLWDLQKGSNVSYIFSTDKRKLSGCTFRGSCKMAISPDESIVVLARDDTLTTYYASSGIKISTRKYSGHSIEYVGFYGQSSQPFVIVRRPMSLKLGSRILDPFNLNSQMKVNRVPVPIIGKTILTFFREGRFKNKALVCEADGNRIRCYLSSEPDAVQVTKSEDTLVNHIYVKHPKLVTELDAKQYELKIRQHEKEFPDGDGSKYWILRIEVVEENQGSNKVVFSFVPEPWMRVSTKDVVNPDELQSVYFLPKGIRFVVAGMQTLQIWSFPTYKFNYFRLDFIWSRPRMKGDSYNPYGRAFKSELVGEYYHCVPQPKIYVDEKTGNIEADFERKGRDDPHHVIIPATRGGKSQSTFLYCARSIYLLAAA